MERSLEKYYLKFERPPFAPTYYPTEEEFADPIAYVAKIKPEAENFGVVKIVPPSNFRPPFAIDSEKFEFTPRVQKLNEIDALFRVRIIFINKLVNFWHLQGQQFRLPWVENKYIDLYRLRKLVEEFGGLKKTNSERKWTQIAKLLGFKNSSASNLKQHYTKWVHPFIKSIEKVENEDEDDEDCAFKPSTSVVKSEKSNESTQSQRRRRSGRMMAGLKQKPLPSIDKSSLPIDSVYCNKCGGGDDEDRLLLCESCDRPLHTYCLDPPLNFVPKGDWRCPKCVVNEVKNVSFEFGFLDSNTKFNLNTFGEWANNFKQNYFKQAPCDVASELVEAEFWQNVVNIDKNVSVKYGADLITSKMGSGFPRKSDIFKGVDAKEKIYYANHPWNLNNLPVLRESVLSHINTDISGMMVPWVYVGMCFSTFCWHVEDHWTYSINYNHWGERKIWYGLAGKDAQRFDEIVFKCVPELFVNQPDLLHHMTTSINPRFLIDKGLSIYTVHQNSGEFVITFPKSYHAGYNEGLNFAEAVNFAPADWLYMGRLCLNNYASVRRTCVFSHEELVMQMVKVADKMSINMCMATLEELAYITTRETNFRKRLAELNLHQSEFCKFEEIPDDERSCRVCLTTLYVSALVCKHSPLRIVCMDHIDQLCNECTISDCCLRYRYTLEDFIPLTAKLTERTNSFEKWKKGITDLNNSEKLKINVYKLKNLIETWKTNRYPHCKEITSIMEKVSSFDKIASSILKIINRKIRLRDNTRCQKIDNRFEYTDLERLQAELFELDIQDESLEKSIKELFDRIGKWRIKVHNTFEQLNDYNKCVNGVDILLELIYEGEEFNLKMSEMDLLRKELNRLQWLTRANQFINWNNMRLVSGKPKNKAYSFVKNEPKDKKNDCDSNNVLNENKKKFCYNAIENKDSETDIDDDSEEENNKIMRFTIEALNKIISEGKRYINDSSDLIKKTNNDLIEMRDKGLSVELRAQEFLAAAEGIGFAVAEKCWLEELHTADWLESKSMNIFRNELQSALDIDRQFLETIENDNFRFSLKVVKGLLALCDRSLFQRNGANHSKLKDLHSRLYKFVDRITNMFQKSIIAGRDDLTALVEGDLLPLVLFSSKKYHDNWIQLRQYNNSTLLMNHLTAISEQQSNLLMALRFVNENRSLKETCSCGLEEAPQTSDPSYSSVTISCFLCKAEFHDVCAQWEPFMDRLLPGMFLCPRCMRSRRPCIEDVEAASETAPHNSLEHLLVENLLKQAIKAFCDLQKTINNFENYENFSIFSNDQIKLIQESFVMSLSLEVIDVEAYKMAFSSSFFSKLFPISQKQIDIWKRMQSRMVESLPRQIIFSSSLNVLTPVSKNSNGSMMSRRNKRCYGRSLSLTVTNDSETNNNELEMDKNSYINNAQDSFTTNGSKKKYRESVYKHEDKEFCAADKCLRPYSEQVRWIQCESGCLRWYHYVCVGQTVKAAQQLSRYTCYRCSSKVISK